MLTIISRYAVGRDDSARRVNRNANFKTTEYVIGNGCQYHLTQWYSFDAVRRVVPQGTFSCGVAAIHLVAPYGIHL